MFRKCTWEYDQLACIQCVFAALGLVKLWSESHKDTFKQTFQLVSSLNQHQFYSYIKNCHYK